MATTTDNAATIRTSAKNDRVLCVDLDGTVLATDLLWETILLLLKNKPWMVFTIPFWLFQGKAYLKRQVASRVKVDARRLPYREEVIDYLRDERSQGRHIALVTGSDHEAIRTIVEYLGLFSEVLSSDGTLNLSGKNKETALVNRFGLRGYDYIGNDSKDVAAWRSAKSAILVDASPRLVRSMQNSFDVAKVFPRKGRLRPAVKALRTYQWSKNLLVFVPVAMAHRLLEWQPIFDAFLSFAAMSMCASGVYVLNDLLDLPADRVHPKKKTRPFAAGTLPIPVGIVLMVALVGIGILVASFLSIEFLLLMMLYLFATTTYSVYVKKLVIADIITLAGLYTLRVLAGGTATNVPISFWLLAFSMFLFLSLAFMKRYVELTLMEQQSLVQSGARAYRAEDLGVLETMGTVAGFMSILVLAFFINSNEVTALYRYPKLLWLVCPALMYWIVRMWFRAHRGSFDDDDPILTAFKDKVSYIVAVLIGGLVFWAT